jgi:TPR repeat protein
MQHCPVSLAPFQFPLVLECGHSVEQASWEGILTSPLPNRCPVCKHAQGIKPPINYSLQSGMEEKPRGTKRARSVDPDLNELTQNVLHALQENPGLRKISQIHSPEDLVDLSLDALVDLGLALVVAAFFTLVCSLSPTTLPEYWTGGLLAARLSLCPWLPIAAREKLQRLATVQRKEANPGPPSDSNEDAETEDEQEEIAEAGPVPPLEASPDTTGVPLAPVCVPDLRILVAEAILPLVHAGETLDRMMDECAQRWVPVVLLSILGAHPTEEKVWPRQPFRCCPSVAMLQLSDCFAAGLGVRRSAKTSQEWETKAAQEGHPVAQVRVAKQLPDHQANQWWHLAARQRHPAAMFHLGKTANGFDPAQRRLWLQQAAQSGHTGAMLSIGSQAAISTPTDQASFNWVLQAANAGLPEACLELGNRFSRGLGVPVSIPSARRWYMLAIAQGNAEAMFQMALVSCLKCRLHRRESSAFLLEAARKNHPAAMHALALRYESGVGLLVNSSLSLKWFRRASDNGNPAGMVAWAVRCTDAGNLNRKSPEHAFRLLLRCENSGEVWYQKGLCHLAGRGTSQSFSSAFEMFALAAANGHGLAAYELSQPRYSTLASPRAATEWCRVAAEGGVRDAQISMGLRCVVGNGVAQSPRHAIYWCLRALEGLPMKSCERLVVHRLGIAYKEVGDLASACMWFQVGTCQKHLPSMTSLRQCLQNSTGLAVDLERVATLDRLIATELAQAPQNASL